MNIAKRIIPCLDVLGNRVVKGINFQNLQDAGNPVELALKYREQGADELVFLDITASLEKRGTLYTVVRSVARELDIPFTVGGGIWSLQDARNVLLSGADKVSVNTAAVECPDLLTQIADEFGSQCVVSAIDAKQCSSDLLTPTSGFEVYTHSGKIAANLDAVDWASQCAKRRAGEILLTSMDFDGTQMGFDLKLTKSVVEAVNIPVIASGGAGSPDHFKRVFMETGVDAALAASVFHYSRYPIPYLKRYLAVHGVVVRL